MDNKSHHHFMWMILVILLALLWHFVCSLKYGLPEPIIHDEFAYLVASDTFAHGRLTNPSHPFWEHFQTFHVFFQPTYQAKYPPCQGLFLAFGQIIFGAPIWGVWISMALACGATFWMFSSTFKPLFALIGSLLVLINPYISISWGQSYWGGGAAMLGGALFFGGIMHIRTRISLFNTLLLCTGVVILANSRPFESFIVCLLAIPQIYKATKREYKAGNRLALVRKVVIPMGVFAILLIAWVLYYNEALGADPLKFYYSNWDYRSATIDLIKSYSGSTPLPAKTKIIRLWAFFIGPYLSLAAPGVLFLLWRKQIIFELVCIITLVTVSIAFSRAWPHYLAPVASLLYFVIFKGICEFRKLKFINSKHIKDICVLLIMAAYFAIASWESIEAAEKTHNRLSVSSLNHRRSIIEKLESDEIKDLLLIHYDENHNIHMEWVYNSADIDHSNIIWARSLGMEKDQRLIDYYADRNIWFLFPDRKPIELIKLRDAGASIVLKY